MSDMRAELRRIREEQMAAMEIDMPIAPAIPTPPHDAPAPLPEEEGEDVVPRRPGTGPGHSFGRGRGQCRGANIPNSFI